jgi:dolichol-phosphate mannosyltransferase
MISLGLIGYYLAKMYEEIKHRPKFIISETSGVTTVDSKI